MCVFFHPGGIPTVINSTFGRASAELLSQNLLRRRFLHRTTTTAQRNVSNEGFSAEIYATLWLQPLLLFKGPLAGTHARRRNIPRRVSGWRSTADRSHLNLSGYWTWVWRGQYPGGQQVEVAITAGNRFHYPGFTFWPPEKGQNKIRHKKGRKRQQDVAVNE